MSLIQQVELVPVLINQSDIVRILNENYALLRLDNFPTNFFTTYVILRAAKYRCDQTV